MKYTTKVGNEIEVKPITMAQRDLFLLIKDVQDLAVEADDDWENRFKMHDTFQSLCSTVNIDGAETTEGDIIPIISIMLNGELPENFTQPENMKD